MNERHLSIGAMAQANGITPRALRIYQQKGARLIGQAACSRSQLTGMPVISAWPTIEPPSGLTSHCSFITRVTLGACSISSARVQALSVSTAPVTTMGHVSKSPESNGVSSPKAS